MRQNRDYNELQLTATQRLEACQHKLLSHNYNACQKTKPILCRITQTHTHRKTDWSCSLSIPADLGSRRPAKRRVWKRESPNSLNALQFSVLKSKHTVKGKGCDLIFFNFCTLYGTLFKFMIKFTQNKVWQWQETHTWYQSTHSTYSSCHLWCIQPRWGTPVSS